eukprot:m.220710 g.220710  ORF g.220710 m.220710 type:complete len:50 (-) comp31324_c0_seq1:134-283(-)
MDGGGGSVHDTGWRYGSKCRINSPPCRCQPPSPPPPVGPRDGESVSMLG